MSLAIVYSRACIGIKAPLVIVEAHLSPGLPGLSIVGLPEAAVRESKDRVRSALINSSLEFPSQRITINLAPADLPKEGSRFDLPIALGILAASDQIPKTILTQYEFAGELALSGLLRPISSILPLALGARAAKRALIVPSENAKQAALPKDNLVYGANDLLSVFNHLKSEITLEVVKSSPILANPDHSLYDLADIKGQGHAKRALEITAAGSHSLLMMGPPGSGKTMLASRLPFILPPLNLQQSLEVLAIHSLRFKESELLPFGTRPFRNPHHSASNIALVGGGGKALPGEISLAHHGILFLDELPEFDRNALEVMREPIESGHILISRARHQAEYPAKFQLIAAMNPCPCGNAGDVTKNCRCTGDQILRYRSKISGPLWDRIDMQIEVPRVETKNFQDNSLKVDTTEIVKARIEKAVALQLNRTGKQNAHLSNAETEAAVNLNKEQKTFVTSAIEDLGLTARTYFRMLRVARTIADLEGSENVERQHLLEALSYRKLDRHH